MRTEDCFRKEHNSVEIGEEVEKREKEFASEDLEVEEQEVDGLMISENNKTIYEKQVKKFAILDLLDLFPPIITYHII